MSGLGKLSDEGECDCPKQGKKGSHLFFCFFFFFLQDRQQRHKLKRYTMTSYRTKLPHANLTGMLSGTKNTTIERIVIVLT